MFSLMMAQEMSKHVGDTVVKILHKNYVIVLCAWLVIIR